MTAVGGGNAYGGGGYGGGYGMGGGCELPSRNFKEYFLASSLLSLFALTFPCQSLAQIM